MSVRLSVFVSDFNTTYQVYTILIHAGHTGHKHIILSGHFATKRGSLPNDLTRYTPFLVIFISSVSLALLMVHRVVTDSFQFKRALLCI